MNRSTALHALPLVPLLATAACSATDPSAAGDCDPVLSVADARYVASAMTEVEPEEEFAPGSLSRCSTNRLPPGDPDEVRAWRFAGVDPGLLLGVSAGGSWQVYVAQGTDEDVRRAALDALS